jgi:hypothetical protein
LEVQGETHETNNPSCDAETSDTTMCDATAPVECGNGNSKNYNDFVAENQPEVILT